MTSHSSTPAERAEEVSADDRSFVFRSWSAQAGLNPMVIDGGAGAWFWDQEGRRYLDFSSQRVNLNLGHNHPKLVQALTEQARTLTTIGQIHATRPRAEAARLIAERTPGDLNKIFFTNCGTDAVEHAVRMAKVHTGRGKVFAMYRSYHGATAGSLSLTGDSRRWAGEPGVPGTVHFIGPYLYRSSFGAASDEQECDRSLAHLEELLGYEGPHNVAAIVLETIVGSNGILVPPNGYLAGVRELCDRHGIVMICDEVMSGFGRCGEWFAADLWDVVPDLITFAKGVNSGYIPLGGVAIAERVARTFADRPFPGGGTYFGHPLACATAVASIHAFEEEAILPRVRRLGTEVIGPALRAITDRHPSVGDVRGMGCFWVLELVTDPVSRAPLHRAPGVDNPMRELERACQADGVSVLIVDNRLYVCPPLIISDQEVGIGLQAIDRALGAADRHVLTTP